MASRWPWWRDTSRNCTSRCRACRGPCWSNCRTARAKPTHATVSKAVLTDALEAGTIGDAAVAESVAQSRAMWHLRESIPLAQSEEGLNIKHDISLPVSRIPAFCAATDAVLAARWPGVRLVNFGHLGDGNLHYNVQAPGGCRRRRIPAQRRARRQHGGVRCRGRQRRVDFGRAWHRRAEARRVGAAQGPDRAGDDACRQARARSAGLAQPRRCCPLLGA